jgi:hypothetical protein
VFEAVSFALTATPLTDVLWLSGWGKPATKNEPITNALTTIARKINFLLFDMAPKGK